MPSIRFLTDSLGRRVAYAVDGTGPALVCPCWWVSHVEEDFTHPAFREFFGALASEYTLVRYDRLGVGLSDRGAIHPDLDAEVDLLERLVAELRLRELALFGMSSGGPIGLRYAARHPDRVTRLVLWGSYLRGAELVRPDVRAAMLALVRAHWGLGSRALADVFLPGMSSQDLDDFTRRQRTATDGETAARLLELTYEFDASEDAPKVRAPALVVHRRRDRAIAFEAGRRLAAALPNATFQSLPGRTHLAWEGEPSPLPSILAFLRGAGPVVLANGPGAGQPASRLDSDARALFVNGQRQPLTRLEFGVMAHLAARVERVVTRDDLLKDVWGQPFGGSNVVDAVIRSLRKKLGAQSSAIETVTGHGYRFTGFR